MINVNTFLKQFAANLKARREALGYTINHAAMLAQVTWDRWRAWEAGERQPSMALLPRIAYALECSVADLVSEILLRV